MPCGETTSRLTASRTPLSSSGCILPASSDAKLASSLGSDARLARWTPRRRRTSVLVLDCVLRMATLSLILVHNTSQHSRSSPMSKTTKSTHTHAHTTNLTHPGLHAPSCFATTNSIMSPIVVLSSPYHVAQHIRMPARKLACELVSLGARASPAEGVASPYLPDCHSSGMNLLQVGSLTNRYQYLNHANDNSVNNTRRMGACGGVRVWPCSY